MNILVRIILSILIGIAAIVLFAWLLTMAAAPAVGLLSTIIGIIIGVVAFYTLPRDLR